MLFYCFFISNPPLNTIRNSCRFALGKLSPDLLLIKFSPNDHNLRLHWLPFWSLCGECHFGHVVHALKNVEQCLVQSWTLQGKYAFVAVQVNAALLNKTA